MLCLSRKLGEKIWIGENVCITVVAIDRGKVRIGIEAPKDVPVYRAELLGPSDPRVAAPQDPTVAALTTFAAAVCPPVPAAADKEAV